MHTLRYLLLISLLTLLNSACATSAGVSGKGSGGVFPGDQDHEAKAFSAVQQRTAFDLDCESAELTRLGDVTRLGQQMTAMTIGARGCDKKATYYVECVSNWGNITCNARQNTQQ